MRVLLTGGEGFIGSHIKLELENAGHEVLAPLDDIRTLRISSPIDAICHQAAITDTTNLDRDTMFVVNVESPLRLFKEAIHVGCKRIVYASSTSVYGNLTPPHREDGPVQPLNPYAESKALLDKEAKNLGKEFSDVRIVGLRYCNVYGPGESKKGAMASMVYRLARQMKKGDPELFKWGAQSREFIFIEDVVRANMLALNTHQSAMVNCATGRARTFNELVDILNAALATNRTPQYVDNPLANRYQSNIECDVSRAREILGFTASYDLERGVNAYRDSGSLLK